MPAAERQDTWNDISVDVQRAIIQATLKGGNVCSEEEQKIAATLRQVAPGWADLVCESIVAFSWCPQQQSNKATFDDTKAFDFIKNLKTLKELRLNTSQAGFAAASIMEQLQEFTNLRTLHIDHTGGTQTGKGAEVDNLKWIADSKLNEFHISWGPELKNQKLRMLMQSLPHCLTNLSVSIGKACDDVIEPYRLSTTQLTMLKLKGLHIDEAGVGEILESTPHLQELSLIDL